jgi:hypothetical protein
MRSVIRLGDPKESGAKLSLPALTAILTRARIRKSRVLLKSAKIITRLSVWEVIALLLNSGLLLGAF